MNVKKLLQTLMSANVVSEVVDRKKLTARTLAKFKRFEHYSLTFVIFADTSFPTKFVSKVWILLFHVIYIYEVFKKLCHNMVFFCLVFIQ